MRRCGTEGRDSGHGGDGSKAGHDDLRAVLQPE